MKSLFVWALLIGLGGLLPAADSLPRSAPEEQGVSSAALLDFVETADSRIDAMNSLMLVRHGHVVAEGWWTPYDAGARHELYSLSKSFTSTAVGLAIAEGKLSLDDEVIKFFPEDAPAQPSGNLKSMRVRDLLCMSTGHQSEPSLMAQNQPWTKTFLAADVPHKPGAHFLYNTPATYMQSAIVQKVTGQTVLDYLRPRLFDPLGIEEPTWGTSPQGISLGGYGLNLRTEDIAKFGQLYLQQGKWHGRALVPAGWVAAATARQTSNGSNPLSDWDQGYGYQFWRSRHNCFRGDGAFGQYCIVLPEQDAVIAITAGVRDMQAVLNLVWDKLLPAMQTASLPADDAAREKLQAKLARLSMPTPQGVAGSEVAGRVVGKRFAMEANGEKLESVGLDDDGGEMTLVLRTEGGEQRIACGKGNWKRGSLAYPPFPARPMAASGAWTSDDTYTAKICFYETPFYQTATLRFAGDELHYHSEPNASFGPPKKTSLVGRIDQ